MIASIHKVAALRKFISACRFLWGANVKTNRWRQVTVPNRSSEPALCGFGAWVVCAQVRDTPDNVYSHHLSYCIRKYE